MFLEKCERKSYGVTSGRPKINFTETREIAKRTEKKKRIKIKIVSVGLRKMKNL